MAPAAQDRRFAEDCVMSVRHYRLSPPLPQVFRWPPRRAPSPADAGSRAPRTPSRRRSSEPERDRYRGDDLDGARSRQEGIGQAHPGPQTGSTVSPILWQAALDTLNFVKFASEDPLTGSIVTDWYSPRGQAERALRVNVFILARALRSDSLAVTVDRQQRSADGQWAETTIARQVETDLENAILSRARQLKRAWAAAPS